MYKLVLYLHGNGLVNIHLNNKCAHLLALYLGLINSASIEKHLQLLLKTKWILNYTNRKIIRYLLKNVINVFLPYLLTINYLFSFSLYGYKQGQDIFRIIQC